MKAKGNIYFAIIDKNNIKKAILKASTNKTNRREVKKIKDNINFYTLKIHEMLKNKSYIPNPYKKMEIEDGSHKKKRTIFKPQFYPDQIIHWALMLQIEELISRGLYDYSCACIKGRGIHYRSKIYQENFSTR